MTSHPGTPVHKEIKLVLPVRLATALHANKILTGAQIGVTVEKALRAYYARLAESAGTPTPDPLLALERVSQEG